MQPDVDVALDTEISSDLLHDVVDYGIYVSDVKVDFDMKKLSNSDDSVDEDENTDKEENAHEDDNADEHENAAQHHNANQTNKVKNSTIRERQDINEPLLASSNRGKLRKNSTCVVTEKFHFSQRTMQCIWNREKKCRAENRSVHVSSRKPKRVGEKKLPIDLSVVSTIALHKKTCIRKLAKALNMSKSSLHRLFNSKTS